MSEEDNGDIGRIIIRVGSTEVDLTGSSREVNDSWLKLKEQDTWASALSKIRTARQDAIEAARKSLNETGVPERGSAFRRLLENCNIFRTGDVILAAIHYLRSVEKEDNTPPREVKKLIEDCGQASKRGYYPAEADDWEMTLASWTGESLFSCRGPRPIENGCLQRHLLVHWRRLRRVPIFTAARRLVEVRGEF